jgi:hypothetical protein
VGEHPLGFSDDWQVTTVSQCLLGGQPVGTNRVPATVARLTVVAAVWSRPGLGEAQVSSREERVARNESTTRQINEDIEQAHQGASPSEPSRVRGSWRHSAPVVELVTVLPCGRPGMRP